VEDEAEIMELIVSYLRRDGHDVLSARDGERALQLARAGVDLVVLDVMIPKPDGLEVTRLLRTVSPVPILIVSARAEESDRVVGLELGADDYLTKPFAPRELLARVKALLRRSQMPSMGSIEHKRLVIDPESRRVKVDDELIELTGREYDILRTMAAVPGKSFTRDELLNQVWGPEYVGEARRVDNYISRLRGKLKRSDKPELIRSIWGVGYRLELS
jgi:two-component system response regulator ResD